MYLRSLSPFSSPSLPTATIRRRAAFAATFSATMSRPQFVARAAAATTTTATISQRSRSSSARSISSAAASQPETIPSTSIRVLRTVEELRRWRLPHTLHQRSVGLVPTMGALHAGHLALVRAAARDNDHVVVSIYVNPAQFGEKEDLASYPVTWEEDTAALAQLDEELAASCSSSSNDMNSSSGGGGNGGRVSAIFAPTTRDMYPSGFPGQAPDSKGSFVTVTPVGEVLEGQSRPTFFRGVATVCMKLFNMVQPDRVYFGQKDVQQTVVVRAMVRDFAVPAEVVVCPTERDADGLALSSRNVYLGVRRRAVARVLPEALSAAAAAYHQRRPGDDDDGDDDKDGVSGRCRDREAILGPARAVVADAARAQGALGPDRRVRFEVDYLSLADPDTLQEVEVVDGARGAVLSGAVKMLPLEEAVPGEDVGHAGGPAVRLIDNIILKPDDEVKT